MIINQWPSTTHPYLTHLFFGLKQQFPNLQLFIYEKGNIAAGEAIIGKENLRTVLTDSIYRKWITGIYKKPKQILQALFHILKAPKHALNIWKAETDKNTINKLFHLINYSALLGKRWDLVHINAVQTASHFTNRSLFQDAPVIVSSRGQDFDFFPDRYQPVLKLADHFHVLGQYLKDKITSLQYPSSKISVIHPAAPITSNLNRQNQEKKDTVFRFVTAARLFWTKGHIYVLRALHQLKQLRPDLKFEYHILGKGPELEALTCEVQRLSLTNEVIFHGWKVEKEAIEIIIEADCYTLFSLEEGFNNSVILAQSLGLPCIVSNAGGLPENISHENTGLVVERYNVEALTQAMNKLVSENDMRWQWGNNAYQRARTTFDLQHQVSAYANLYKEAIQH